MFRIKGDERKGSTLNKSLKLGLRSVLERFRNKELEKETETEGGRRNEWTKVF